MSKPTTSKYLQQNDGIRILYVDDAQYMHRVLQLALTEKYVILHAYDGVEGLEILNQQMVDIIITDINMPNMNGIELLKKLRQLPQHKKTPVLLITAEEGNDDLKQQARQFGANGFLLKPFKPAKLINSINHLIS